MRVDDNSHKSQLLSTLILVWPGLLVWALRIAARSSQHCLTGSRLRVIRDSLHALLSYGNICRGLKIALDTSSFTSKDS